MGAGQRLGVLIERLTTDGLARGDEAELAQRVANVLSARISALPAHWPWMHPSFARDTRGRESTHIEQRGSAHSAA